MISNRVVDLGSRLVPQSVRHRIQQVVSLTDLKLRYFGSLKPLTRVKASDDTGCVGDVRLGIVHNAAQYHTLMRSRAALGRLVRRAFARGVVSRGTDRRDREWGRVLLQEYLPDVREWRLVRIGDSFLCRLNEWRGDLHSGSGVVGWARPSERLLGFVREITERGAFRSMDIDVFETVDGRLLVNELQTVFGSIREANLDRGAENRGQWRLDEADGDWQFEPGDFYRNACANERVRDALERGLRRPPGADRRRPAGPQEIRQAP